MGVWIETYGNELHSVSNNVTPHVGVWIETRKANSAPPIVRVTPHVGVWIETSSTSHKSFTFKSRPTWACGLKLEKEKYDEYIARVTPHVGVWIETFFGVVGC